jgi:predicted acyl esterase
MLSKYSQMKRLLLLLTLLISSTATFAQPLTPIIDSVPMRDGRKLPVDIFLPAGWTSGPVILIQTPYNRLWFRLSLPLGVGTNINGSNYAFVTADWRGFYGGAQANYSGAPSRGQDGYDLVEWIAAQTWSNGETGTWGPSALGKVQFETARENPPHLTCICPLVAGPQFNYQEYYPNGCYRTEYVEQLDGLGYGLSPVLLANPARNIIWQFAEADSYYPDSILVPAFMIGGWYDHNIDVMLDFFNGIRTQSPTNVQNQHRLLMGPWAHGGNGSATVGSANQGQLTFNNAAGWSDSLAIMYFDYHMRGIQNGWNNTPYVQYYTIGSNTWNSTAAWPPSGFNPVTLYMHSDTTLDVLIPSQSSGSISYLYDPQDPSPTVGGATLRQDLDQGPYDQSDSVETRNDILKFTTAPLAQDMTVSGEVVVHLEISSDKFDTDFCVRLCDVYPTGESMLVQDGVYRMCFRDGFAPSDTGIMTPNAHYAVDITLPATSITFLQGHRIRVDVTSSNYPRFNRNMNTGQAMYPGPIATAGDTLVNPQIANNTIYTNSVYSSRVTLPATTWPNGVTENIVQPSVRIFPNPSNEYTRFEFASSENASLIITDAIGRTVYESQVTGNSALIDTQQFANGIYSVTVVNENGVQTSRFAVQH